MKMDIETESLDLLGKLVGIESVNPIHGGSGEAGVVDFLEKRLAAKGISFFRQEVLPGRFNVVARVGPRDAPAVLLDAHMDTVGVAGWAEGSPFELREDSGRHYGRGACDTKASLACFLLTLEYFADRPEKLKGALVFAATVDEESEQLGAFELAKLKDDLHVVSALAGEPTRSDVISRHKGVGRYLVTVDGKAAHASTPELGENAIYKAARICGRLDEHAQALAQAAAVGEIDRGTLNVGMIDGGVGFNVVPDACRLDIDRRLGRHETADEARAALHEICGSEAGARLEVFLERPPLVGRDSEGLVRSILEAAQRAGTPVVERDVPYMTNAVAYEQVGIPAVVFGPGDIAQAHKVDEYIEDGEMGRCFEILRELLSAD